MAKIAFQGEQGANSDTACRNAYPNLEPLPCSTFEDSFNAVEKGEAELAMIPIENTIAGRVADIHHLLPESRLHIIGEYFLPIHFNLMALPGARIEDIKSAHSHVHGLGQCRNIIRKHRWRAVIEADTAGAARVVAEAGRKDQASLSPPLAAELYGLEVLAENVEDHANNITRFVILSKNENRVPRRSNGKTITTFVFKVRNIPAALYKAMGGFATNGVNMTKLESYQLGGKFYSSQFYADIEGHPDDPNVALALEELDFFSKDVRILGVYPAHPDRYALD